MGALAVAELIKAFVFIFAVSAGGFVYARMAFGEFADSRTLARWRNLFLAVITVSFLTPNFWLFLFLLALVIVVFSVGEKIRPAPYLLLLFAIPVADSLVPGIGGINGFLNLYPFNILALVILWPFFFRANANRPVKKTGSTADFFFILFALLTFALSFRDTTITDGFRQWTSFMLTAFGPYLAFSRFGWTKESLRLATLAFVLPLIILSALAIVESVMSWHLFQSAVSHWNIWHRAIYSWRSGFLRAYTTVFEPIAFGLFIAIAIPLALALIHSLKRRTLAIGGLGVLILGLIVTFSRGPWVGAAFAAIVFTAVSGRLFSSFTKLAGAGVIGLMLLSVTPMGDKIMALLPFVGDSSTDSVDYRQRLMDVGWSVAMENKWFGSETYMRHPAMQQLVQGQGIIDIVNSYLRVTLESGLVGLFLFIGVCAFSLLALWRSIPAARKADPELAVYGQAWLAALACLLLVIATTSSVVAQVAEVQWLLCGMCVGVARAAQAAAARKSAEPEKDPPPPAVRGKPPAPAATAPNLPPHLRQYAPR
jgi:hypothetical protein